MTKPDCVEFRLW